MKGSSGGIEIDPNAHHDPTSEGHHWVNYSEMNQLRYTSMITSLGLVSSLITQPFTVVMTRQQVGTIVTGDKSAKSNVLHSIKEVITTIGWRGLFRGWVPIATMGVPSQMIYFTITETSREYLQRQFKKLMPNASRTTIDGMQAACSAIVANSISYVPYLPADVLSSRMMIQGRNGHGMLEMIKIIHKESGVRGFFKGFSASLLYGCMYSFQWWWSYSVSRRELLKLGYMKEHPVLMDGAAGLFAGVAATVCAHPLDTLKTRIMTKKKVENRALYTIAKNVIQQEGAMALFRGIRASCYQAAVSSTGFALGYELIKRYSTLDADMQSIPRE
jgi:hypothetical protein